MTESTSGGYAAIADELRRQIEDGSLQDGALPSEADLMAAHGVARTTVRRALKVLEAEGLILSRQGRGWHVSQDAGGLGSAAEIVAGRIREDIGTGRLAQDGRIPAELALAEHYTLASTCARSGAA